jgi:hypothetical protein
MKVASEPSRLNWFYRKRSSELPDLYTAMGLVIRGAPHSGGLMGDTVHVEGGIQICAGSAPMVIVRLRTAQCDETWHALATLFAIGSPLRRTT